MDEVAAKVLKDFGGVTDEDLAKVPRNVERIARNFPRALPYKVVAEVTSSKYCLAGIKVGDKIVFDPWLNLQETTCTPCPRALIPVLIALQSYWERFIELLDRGIEEIDAIDDVVFFLSEMNVSKYIVIFFLPLLVSLLTGVTMPSVAITFPFLIPFIGNGEQAKMGLETLAFSGIIVGLFLTPVHLCMALSASYFETSLTKIIIKVLPPTFFVAAAGILMAIFFG